MSEDLKFEWLGASGLPAHELVILSTGEPVTLFRVRALKAFDTLHGHIKQGALGGFTQTPYNLSQKGSCWIFDDSYVWQKAIVSEDAVIKNRSEIRGASTQVRGHSVIDHCKLIHAETIFDIDLLQNFATTAGR